MKSNRKKTYLIIGSKDIAILKNENHVWWYVHQLYITRDRKDESKIYEYDLFNNLMNSNLVDIWIKLDDKSIQRLKLPKTLSKKIWEYLRIQQNPSVTKKHNHMHEDVEEFNCASFVHFIYNIKYAGRLRSSRDFFEYKDKDLEIWDVVLTGQKSWDWNTRIPSSHHFSLYLWNNKYISKGWADLHSLLITDLAEMSKIYPYDEIFILRPKNK